MSFSDQLEIVVDHVEPNGPTTSHLTGLTVRPVRNKLSADGRLAARVFIASPRPEEQTINVLREALCQFVAKGGAVPMGDSFQLGGWQAVMLTRDVVYNECQQRCVRARFSVVPAIDGWDARELAEIFHENAVEVLERVEGKRR